MPSRPFLDENDVLDTQRVVYEAVPIAKIVGLFAAVAAVPFLIVLALGPRSGASVVFAFVGQFVLAVGAGVVVVYAVARGVRVAEEPSGE